MEKVSPSCLNTWRENKKLRVGIKVYNIIKPYYLKLDNGKHGINRDEDKFVMMIIS